MKRVLFPLLCGSLALGVCTSTWSMGRDDAPGQVKKQTRPGARSGLIQPSNHVHDRNEPLDIAIVLPGSIKALRGEDPEAEAYLVVLNPDSCGEGETSALTVPLRDYAPDKRRFWVKELAVNDLCEGDYQLAIVLMPAEGPGSPLMVTDWYGGFSGLVSAARIKLVDGEHVADLDDDGELDDDMDGDGFDDSEDDEEEDESEDDMDDDDEEESEDESEEHDDADDSEADSSTL